MKQAFASVELQQRKALFWILFASLSSGLQPQRADCSASTGNKCKVSFPKIQLRIASLGIEPGASNLCAVYCLEPSKSSWPKALFCNADQISPPYNQLVKVTLSYFRG